MSRETQEDCHPPLLPFLILSLLQSLSFSKKRRIIDDCSKQSCTTKAILSKDPALYPDEYVVLIIYGEGGLAYIKPGGPAPLWIFLKDISGEGGFCDVIYSKSSGLFLGLDWTGEVYSIDITRVGLGLGGVECITPPLINGSGLLGDGPRYIVETPSGDLLQVHRYLTPAVFMTMRTLEVGVFKFLNKNWSQLETLGDNALFVGDATSMCVSASDFPGCHPGSVYFTLPYRKYFVTGLCLYGESIFPPTSYKEGSLHYDLGVFDINTKGVESFLKRPEFFKIDYPTTRRSMYQSAIERPPIWVLPTFQDRSRKEEEDAAATLKRPRKEDDHSSNISGHA